jgi:hypothetical protein
MASTQLPALYELSNEYIELYGKLMDGDFDEQTVTDTIESTGIVDRIQQKAEAIEQVARSLEMFDGAIDAEIERLKNLKGRRQKNAARLRGYLLHEMKRTGITSIECARFRITVVDNPVSVDIFDQDQIPAQYMRQPDPQPAVPDKVWIRQALKAGTDVPGARLKESQRLKIT